MADVPLQPDVHSDLYVTDIIAAGTAHRAYSIFHGHIVGDQLAVRGFDKAFWDHKPIPYIRMAGFADAGSHSDH